MRVELAVEKLIDAAHDSKTKPETLARLFALTLTKVAHINPQGDAALKIVRSKMLSRAIEAPIQVVKRHRRTKAEMIEARAKEKGRKAA